MADHGSLAVHQSLSSNDFGTIDFCKALVTETNAEHGNSGTEVFDKRESPASAGVQGPGEMMILSG